MQRLATALLIAGLVLTAVPATAATDTLEENNREWVETKLGVEPSGDHPIIVTTDDGNQQRSTAWLVDRIAQRFTDAGIELPSDGPRTAASSDTPGQDDFPVASTIMILWEEVVIEGDDDPRQRNIQPGVGCSQGGGATGGHYDHARPTPEEAQDEVWDRAQVGDLPPAFPEVQVTSWYGAGSYDYVGTASSSLSVPGSGELMTFAPTLDATVEGQHLEHDTRFTYDDARIQYTGSSDFWCIQWEDSRSGDFHVLNAPLIDGVVHEIPY